ncbi:MULTISPECIES: phosphoenolpyruvate--protein phosphotransferase [Bacillaceae]|jgi:phosphoenolpyruvate-protein phosphotransferase (PTS system enzyme I)|uniref:phosphoenolpyruvate--protein phosphotransferase n=1 Tax=Bacillaceae TaxID=186817 RepID=UPI001D0612A6|nr:MULTISPECIES: phosphoenolpyruvate--protein phosphotransferase [Caldibacillus]MCB5935076.1 phosphoenolpyruvate--protein phosphotransferase [Bacillus sp. DFI.2.34]MCB7070010.1 phosphoenolpyruvate--protein phosphotransferase [Caldibacillus sp. 210928-DFI.2.22]MCB7073478.1 phosphoenolpyruvate--protein phosphotransferase [Caldibacillus sp. 210928-DFI.2.18]MCB7076998.1 phosphoenolpyruvate--protein phosphotransferase [Caldibacillus thermoamylovorans]MCM3055746.1 phosphoenolpyruvate--protein phosph
MSTWIKGIAASSGIAIGKAYRLVEPDLSFQKTTVEDSEKEISRFRDSLRIAKSQLEAIRDHAREALGPDKAEIFEAHLLILNDPEIVAPIEDKIKNEKMNAEAALQETTDMFIGIFEQMDNEYMRERAADIRDVRKRVLAGLLNVTIPNPSMISEEVIIVAEDLTPSDTAQLNRKFVKGFTTDIGGRTSHSAIMARSLEIPAVVGTKTATKDIQNGDFLILDGLSGEVHINPTEELIEEYKKKQADYEAQLAEWAKLVNEPSISKDGVQVELVANIGTPKDVEGALHNGAEGVGLFRTEFLYMGRDELPSEEDQFAAYKAVLEGMEGRPVVVRTLDIGGDKKLSYLPLPEEMNPFLGHRAIRLCLDRTDIFRTQLRALLRASVYGKLKVMFPMIATLNEFREAKKLFLEEKDNLAKEGIPTADHIELGIMVEIPSTAVLADQFAKEVDFFSIGTNDLIQYTMAADRMNEQVSYLYQPYNPSILRLVKMVIDASHKEGKWTGMCGEMAGDETAVPLLLGLGLDEFSMSATSILKARSLIRKLSKAEMEKLAQEALQKSTVEEVIELVKNAVK